MKLYQTPGTCSLFPLIVLFELDLPFSSVRVDLRTKRTALGEDFLATNPKGKVPALALDTGEVLTEGPAIVQFLLDRRPDSELEPAAQTMARVRFLEWMNFLTSDVHKSFATFFEPSATEEVRNAARRTLTRHFGHVDAALASAPYLLGERFSVADAYLFTLFGWVLQHRIDVAAFERLASHKKRVGARRSVTAALEHERQG